MISSSPPSTTSTVRSTPSYTPSHPSVLHFLAMLNNKCIHSISVTWGQKPHLHTISSSPPPTASTVRSTPPHALPTPPLHFISLPQSITSHVHSISIIWGQNPTSATSALACPLHTHLHL